MKNLERYRFKQKAEPVGLYTQEKVIGKTLWKYEEAASRDIYQLFADHSVSAELVLDTNYRNSNPAQEVRMIVSLSTGQEFVDGTKRH